MTAAERSTLNQRNSCTGSWLGTRPLPNAPETFQREKFMPALTGYPAPPDVKIESYINSNGIYMERRASVFYNRIGNHHEATRPAIRCVRRLLDSIVYAGAGQGGRASALVKR